MIAHSFADSATETFRRFGRSINNFGAGIGSVLKEIAGSDPVSKRVPTVQPAYAKKNPQRPEWPAQGDTINGRCDPEL